LQPESQVVYNKRVKIGLYDPYLDTFGGGEKYMFDIAAYVSHKHHVSFFWKPSDREIVLQQAKKRFSVQLDNVSFTKDIFSVRSSLMEKYRATKQFDAIIYLSDGSFPFLFSKKNILMFQQPIDWVKPSLLTTLKLGKIHKVICNSHFTENHIEKVFGARKTQVIYPCVSSVKNADIAKQHIILSVGRFTQGTNVKKQEDMIEAFKKTSEKLKGWRLVLIGGTQTSDEAYFYKLQEQAKGYPITLLKNVDKEELVSYYNKAMLYWHAAGFGEDLASHAERAEHFGISTVEAMSTGCVPIVFAAGGQTEIVINGVNGYTWHTLEELEAYTEKIAGDAGLLAQLAEKAEERAKDFEQNIFENQISQLLSL